MANQTIRQLADEAAQLEKQLGRLAPDDDAFDALVLQYQDAKRRLSEMRGAIQSLTLGPTLRG